MIKIETDMMLTIRFLCFRIVRKKKTLTTFCESLFLFAMN
jgi:hypothetical protein